MRRLLCLALLCFSSVIFLMSCDSEESSFLAGEYTVNDFSKASMTIDYDTVTATGLTVQFRYSGSNQGQYGEWYTLLVYQDEEWQELPYIIDTEVAWLSIAYPVRRLFKSEKEINWELLYGELGSGRYLIIKDFIDYRSPGDYSKYYFACEFAIE